MGTRGTIGLSITGWLCAGLLACGQPSPKSALEAEMSNLPPWALGKCEETLKNKDAL
jgi:hypothetical protein